MLKTLRLQLTLICALTTGAIVCTLSLLLLSTFEKRLYLSVYSALDEDVSALAYRLKNDSLINWDWLTQTETAEKLIIHIETNNVPLKFPGAYKTQTERSELINAFKHAKDNTQPLPNERYELFGRNGESYLATSMSMPVYTNNKTDHLLLIVIKEISDIRIADIRIYCFIVTGVSMAVLALFAWWFSGKAILPIEENIKRQTVFTASASHELRSPLTVIRASAETLQYEVTERGKPFAKAIESECIRFSHLIDDLLILAGADAGRLNMRFAPVEPETPILKSVQAFMPLANKHDINIIAALPDAKMLPVFIGDEERIIQLLEILTDNALRYTPQGGSITLSASAEINGILIQVQDTGCGIPDSIKSLVQGRFYRADTSRSSKEHYGLGLSIAADLMKLHNGTITLHDTPGGGLTVNCLFPFDKETKRFYLRKRP